MDKELILIIDFYGQYNQLIARRVRECNVYSEIVPFSTSIEKIKQKNPKGIIFTGGPASVYAENAPKCSKEIFNLGIPVLGICYGMQLMTHMLGGKVQKADKREYGVTSVNINNSSKLFKGFEDKNDCLMSHTDFVENLPEEFENIGSTDHCPNAAMQNTKKNFYGIQFHPEVNHTNNGTEIIKNFVYNICGCSGNWKMSSFAEETVTALKQKIGDKKALCALSGGVDSSVAAALINKAIGKNLTCIFVDHGLLRKNEAEEVEQVFTKNFDVNFIKVDAKERFLNKLKGITDPEQKRKIIGEEFIRVFEEEAKKIGTVDYLVQGTIYPDVIESGLGAGAKIKSHHNVGGLPDYVDFKEIVEPLRDLFKDEVRKVGLELGLPEFLVYRQPFPGPGLAIRVIGDITENKLDILKDADSIFREEVAKAGWDRKINQYFAVLTNIKSVGVMGDERTYDYTIALRAVTTSDFMTAEWTKIPYEILEIATRKIMYKLHDTIIWYRYNQQPANTDRQLTNQCEFVYMLRHTSSNIKLNKELLYKEKSFMFKTKNVGNVWELPFNYGGNKVKNFGRKELKSKFGHSGFPIDLPESCILLSTKENDLVLDCFMGSGSTGVACMNTNRNFIGIELENKYYKIAKKRLNDSINTVSLF